ncbi:MAG: arginase family protein [Micromonosporaceae bacterium]|nr:arginase family protein [Micromonosporaceae bacterium]
MRRIAVLDAPSNLGLRPPSPGVSPGCAKAPGALRDHALVARLKAVDAGCLTAPRYDPEDWRPEDGVCQAEEIADYTERLAGRIAAVIDRGELPLVLGGDCSIVLGAALAMRRRREQRGGRHGLVFIDGHSDFRHAGNAEYVGAAAGEDLALVTGRGQGGLTNIDGMRPYFREEDVVVLGIRDTDEYRMDLKAAGVVYRTVPQIRAEGPRRSAAWAYEELGRVEGFWLHVDIDVLDPAAMPAVDAPDPGGIAFVELEQMIADLVARPTCLGLEVTVFDPDYDPDGRYAAQIVDTLVGGLRPIWQHSQQPLDTDLHTDPAEPDHAEPDHAGR